MESISEEGDNEEGSPCIRQWLWVKRIYQSTQRGRGHPERADLLRQDTGLLPLVFWLSLLLSSTPHRFGKDQKSTE